MKRQIVLNGELILFTIRYSSRARSLRMTIGVKDGLVVTVPGKWHERFIEGFLRQKATWILKHLKAVKSMEDKIVIPSSHTLYVKNKAKVLRMIEARVKFFNAFYKFSYRKISIRNQTSVWGSCTRGGNLQFNYKLMYVPQKTVDYIVVHELCHLKEHNHGPGFWRLVEKLIPNHRVIRASLRKYVLEEE